jgi:DNA processing protein
MAPNALQQSQRLALLLAGGGLKCRRLVAAVPADKPPLTALADCGLPRALSIAAREALDLRVPRLLKRIEEAGWRWLIPSDAGFPSLLTQISDPPLGLFVRGRLQAASLVAIVGSRRASPYGLQVARLLGEEIARAGVVVVSGMARGVDAAAHEGALAANGTTWAVWGTGPDCIYPPEHGDLAERIGAKGALLTEFPPGTPPRRHHFPQRNRILAGMSSAVVVVEATARSGALVTARLAVDEGREVFAVPGSILSDLSVGPNALLRMGARPILTPRDVLEFVGVEPVAANHGSDPRPGIMGHLEPGEAVTVDELASRSGRTIPQVLEEMLRLEMDGIVDRRHDGRYSLVRGMRRDPRRVP